jgi:integrase
MSKRQPGTGTIEPLSSGRFRVRIWLADGVRHNFGPFDTEGEAQDTLDAIALEVSESGVSPALGVSWSGWLETWQKSLQASKKYVGMANVRSIIRKRLKLTPFADWPLRRITEFVVRRWVSDLSKRTDLSFSSKQQTMLYARKAFQAAVDADVLDKNPAVGLKVERGLARTEEPWTYLTLDEQTALMASEVMPREWRLMIAFAFGTGLRAGEQWNLRLADLHLGADPHVVVRFGSRKRAPKGRKIRRVPLFGIALDAARQWVAQLGTWCPKNPDGLAFPGPQGGRQKVSRLPEEWRAWLDSAGVTRRLRWHDLRHTCGSSLVSGWWGRTWTLQEVRDLLGHASIDETERYAHLGETALKKAARDTGGPQSMGDGGGAGPSRSTSGPNHGQNAANSGVGVLPRYSPRTSHETAEKLADRTSGQDSAWTTAADIARQLAQAAAAGSPEAHVLRRALGASVFASRLVTLAGQATGDGPHALDRALELAALVLDLEAADRRSESTGTDGAE